MLKKMKFILNLLLASRKSKVNLSGHGLGGAFSLKMDTVSLTVTCAKSFHCFTSLLLDSPSNSLISINGYSCLLSLDISVNNGKKL